MYVCMKKMFTLLMAIVVTMSVSALPLNLIQIDKQQGLAKHQTESSIKKQQHMEQLRMVSPVMEKRQAVPAD